MLIDWSGNQSVIQPLSYGQAVATSFLEVSEEAHGSLFLRVYRRYSVKLHAYSHPLQGATMPFQDAFALGDSVVIRTATKLGNDPWTDEDTGEAIDPTTVTFTVRAPDASETDYVYGSDPEVVRTAEGDFHIVVDAAQEGEYQVRVVGTGDGKAADRVTFTVDSEWEE